MSAVSFVQDRLEILGIVTLFDEESTTYRCFLCANVGYGRARERGLQSAKTLPLFPLPKGNGRIDSSIRKTVQSRLIETGRSCFHSQSLRSRERLRTAKSNPLCNRARSAMVVRRSASSCSKR